MNGNGRFYRLLVVLTALSGASIILLGAWGAHRLDGSQQRVFDTALRYQAWHTLALVAVLMPMTEARWQRLRSVCGLWWLGMLLFSGSLYLMVLAGWRVGLMTPCGGLLLTMGWLWLARQWWCLARDRRIET